MSAAHNRDVQRGRLQRLAIACGFALLLLAACGTVIVGVASARAERLADQAQQIRQSLADLFSTIQDVETGQRGYLLTGDAVFLQPLQDARSRIDPSLARLRTLLSNQPEQLTRYSNLATLVRARVGAATSSVAMASGGRRADATLEVRQEDGRLVMQKIRSMVTAMDTAERQILGARMATAVAQRTALLIVTLISLALAGVLAGFVWLEMHRTARALAWRNQALLQEAEQRGRAEAQLRQVQKMEALGQLTGGVAHDFNNMLAVIAGNLDLLQRRLKPGDHRGATLVRRALEGAERAAALTQRLLAFSRRQPLAPRPLDVNACVADLSGMLTGLLGEKIDVRTRLDQALWTALIDPPQLESALVNLAVNARDAMPAGGVLTISTRNLQLDAGAATAGAEAGDYVVVEVADTGSGMVDDVLERAFDPFFTTKEVGRGTGLGLSQVHGFVRQSNGYVELSSEVGRGTQVRLHLPRDRSDRRPLAGPTAPTGDGPVEGLVLVVEDDGAVRRFTVEAVAALGYDVVEAADGDDALAQLRRHEDIRVLLTDVVMPRIDGSALALAARQLRPNLRVVFMSGYSRAALAEEQGLGAAVRLLRKPFSIDALDRELRGALTAT
ncbi:CHASE3 domain-containing protein [Caulobacter sp. KR2-114]|uniref:CHASE3 domain-containing protein n=1 Tax=Caulobacter sp. KR2-114 TaxID=3400912 RepID=UPI003C06D125